MLHLNHDDHISTHTLIVRDLGLQDYQPCWQAMQTFTNQRNDITPDELWLLEHPPVFTLGQNSDRRHILQQETIPIVSIDRGGQVTYHGPGQLVAYTLIDIRRKGLSIRQFVTKLEQAVIDLLAQDNIHAEAKRGAPGVYVNDEKICSIGLRIRRGYAFHGLALNVDMDLRPFQNINPCGYAGLKMTQLAAFNTSPHFSQVKKRLTDSLMNTLEYHYQHQQGALS